MSRTKGKKGRVTPRGGGDRPPRPSCKDHGRYKWCENHQRWEHP